MTEVIDRNGKRVTRPNGILQDGDRLTVKLTMMDAQNPMLAQAAAAAEAIRRAELFDVLHRPGIVGSSSGVYVSRDSARATNAGAYEAGDKARQARDAKMRDAWKNPPSVQNNDATALEQVAIVGPSAPKEQLFAARDQAIANRNKRLEAAWQR